MMTFAHGWLGWITAARILPIHHTLSIRNMPEPQGVPDLMDDHERRHFDTAAIATVVVERDQAWIGTNRGAPADVFARSNKYHADPAGDIDARRRSTLHLRHRPTGPRPNR